MMNRKRIAVGIGAAAVALVIGGSTYKDISAQEPGFAPAAFGQGGPGRPGGPGGPGGPMGRRGGPGGPMGPGGPGMLPPLPLGRLDLSDDQESRVRQIMESHREEQRALMDRSMKAHEALAQASATGAFDEGLVRARAADVAAVDADMAVARARIFSEVYQILTPDQQAELKKVQEQRDSRQDRARERRQQRQR